MLRVIKYGAVAVAMSMAAGAAARTAASWFSQAPARVISGVPRTVRLDAIDYFRSGLARDVMADSDTPVRVTEMTDRTLTFRHGEHTSVQIAVLPAGRDTVLAVVTTVDAPTPVSGIRFYDRNWEPLPKQPFVMPAFSEWLVPGADADVLQATLGFMPATVRFNESADSLIMINSGIENARLNGVEDSLIPSLTYSVRNAKFRPAK
ncbi:MAG: DUF3256 family protein [Muribaculaceae bacterium]|nr:DUF3256 family protein [Muribaculaceae bacterium]